MKRQTKTAAAKFRALCKIVQLPRPDGIDEAADFNNAEKYNPFAFFC